MEWGAAIVSVLGIVLLVLKQWQANQPKRDQENRADEIQQGRADIDAGNAAAVNDRIDRLLTESDHPPGQSGSPVTAGRLSAILRVADGKRGAGADTGAGRSLSISEINTRTVETTGAIFEKPTSRHIEGRQ